MAILIYFFVVLVMASSVLFGMDWIKGPLQPPASPQPAQIATSAESERLPPPRPAVKAAAPQADTAAANARPARAVTQRASAAKAAVPFGRTQAAPAATETAAAPAIETTGSAPAETLTAETKPAATEANAPQAAAVRSKRPRTAHRHTQQRWAAGTPAWAIQGAEAARRQAAEARARTGAWPYWARTYQAWP